MTMAVPNQGRADGRRYVWISAAAVRIEDASECVEDVSPGAVEYVHAATFGNDHACFAELTEVVADGGFGEIDTGGEIAGADLAVVGGEQDRHEFDPNRVS